VSYIGSILTWIHFLIRKFRFDFPRNINNEMLTGMYQKFPSSRLCYRLVWWKCTDVSDTPCLHYHNSLMTEEAAFYITVLLSYKTARCHVLNTRYLHLHGLNHLRCLKIRTKEVFWRKTFLNFTCAVDKDVLGVQEEYKCLSRRSVGVYCTLKDWEKRELLSNTQSVPRSKHCSCRLYKPVS
jgi:hypothetical protein